MAKIEHKGGASLSHRAELFRSKLIDDFQILETTSEQGRRKAPIYSTTDILNPDVMELVLSETPEQMIKFKAYKRMRGLKKMNVTGHRLTRVANQKKLPYGVWANLVVESSIFQTILLVVTTLSSIFIGIQGELPHDGNAAASAFNVLFDLFDDLIVILFTIEIVLKWLDNFKEFWKDLWNISDLVITVVSIISTILLHFASDRTSQLAKVAERLAVFRILRVLKLITRLTKLRIVILTVLQTFQYVVFILLLLLIVTFVYSVIGVVIFQSYTQSSRNDLAFHQCFNGIPNTMLTLFQLFTLDQWYDIYKEVSEISDPIVSIIYILFWILIGSFVFRNLFVGIMVNNFQSLSAELVRSRESHGKTVELERLKRELSAELLRHDQNQRMKEAKYSGHSSELEPDGEDHESSLRIRLAEQEMDDREWSVDEEEEERRWGEIVEEHLTALASSPVETLWPRDSLFRYYQVMEQLQDNLEKYEQIQESIAEVMLEIHQPDKPARFEHST